MNASDDSAVRTNLADTLATQGTLTTFSKAINAAGLTDIFNGAGPLTVFAPSDAAFEKLDAGQLDSWLKPENKAQLISVIKHHVAPGRTTSVEVGKLNAAETVGGQPAVISMVGGKITVGDASITTPDVAASNGVIHVIDAVMMPKTMH